MGIKEEIEEEVARIKSQLSMAHDNGDKYQYIKLSQIRHPYVWSEQQINEMLRGLTDTDAIIINMFATDGGKYDKGYAFLFELIYR